MKKITFLLPILVLFTVSPLAHPVWAMNPPRLTTMPVHLTQAAARISAIPTKIAEHQTNELAMIQKTADTMITNRITELNKLLTRIQNDTRLSSDDKTTLTNNINTMISNLQALKTKIDADTDVTTARADRKSIVTSYHVFVTFDPQTRLLTIIGNLQNTATTIANLVPELQTLSSNLKSQGKDTTTIDAAIADINTQITNINTLLSADKTKLQGISDTTSGNAAIFTAVRQDMATVRADFGKIRQDMITIRSNVHQLTPKTTPTPTATPTPSA